MKVKIICVGKLKEKYLKDAIGEYAKRLSRFCNFEICELNDERIPDNASEAECRKILQSEGETIIKNLSKDSYVVALCVEGKAMSSEDFAQCIQNITLGGKSTIDFVIGGSLGFSDEVKKLSNLRLSFSSFTFPHQLMRLILAEQIYRGFKIINNEEYHK